MRVIIFLLLVYRVVYPPELMKSVRRQHVTTTAAGPVASGRVFLISLKQGPDQLKERDQSDYRKEKDLAWRKSA